MHLVRSVISLFLAVLVFISSTSFTVNMHLCMGDIQDMAIFSQPEGCGMEEDEGPKTATFAKAFLSWDSCCKDTHVAFDGNDYNVKAGDRSLSPITEMAPAVLPFRTLVIANPVITASPSCYSLYKPPVLERDVPVLVQSFLL